MRAYLIGLGSLGPPQEVLQAELQKVNQFACVKHEAPARESPAGVALGADQPCVCDQTWHCGVLQPCVIPGSGALRLEPRRPSSLASVAPATTARASEEVYGPQAASQMGPRPQR